MRSGPNRTQPVDTVIDLIFDRITQAELARRLGISTPSINEWKRRGSVPLRRVLAVSRITGLSPHLIDPKAYPDPDWRPPT